MTVALVVAAGAAAAAVLAARYGDGFGDWLFLTIVLSGFSLLLRQAVLAWRQASTSRRDAQRLTRTEPGVVALAAVREERRRLSEDIARCLQDALESIQVDADRAAADSDPRPMVRRIRGHATVATSELRRQLGLLQAEESKVVTSSSAVAPALLLQRRDLVIASAVATLAGLEAVATSLIDGVAVPWLSVLLIVVAAATVVFRRVFPRLGALVCATTLLAGLGLDAPVFGNFFSLGVVCALVWTICVRGRQWIDAVGALVLVLATLATTWVVAPVNLGFMVVVVGVTVLTGAAVRWGRRIAVQSKAVAEQRHGELQLAADTAAAAERALLARELHDVVSHAVGLIAVQAGAAEVVWATDRGAYQRSVAIIADTATQALLELDRLLPGRAPTPRTYGDLLDLAERIRLAGTPVTLDVDADPQAWLDSGVYRIVQEALTNVVRHAPRAAAVVRIQAVGSQTRVEVIDDGPADTGPIGRGYGLVGLAERVRLAGGDLDAGPLPDGTGFGVVANLPTYAGPVGAPR